MGEVNTSYRSYVHTGNSGFEVKVDVEFAGGYAAQFISTSLHAYGMPHETKMWVDDNVLDALEYIITKAREQRATIPEFRDVHTTTSAAKPRLKPVQQEKSVSACDANEEH